MARREKVQETVNDVAAAMEMPLVTGADIREPGVEPEERKYKPRADPFGIASDFKAGVYLAESRRFRRAELAFDEKPSDTVIAKLKENGYRWSPQDKLWTHPIHREDAMATRIEAERLYQDISKMIREEKNMGEEQARF